MVQKWTQVQFQLWEPGLAGPSETEPLTMVLGRRVSSKITTPFLQAPLGFLDAVYMG